MLTECLDKNIFYSQYNDPWADNLKINTEREEIFTVHVKFLVMHLLDFKIIILVFRLFQGFHSFSLFIDFCCILLLPINNTITTIDDLATRIISPDWGIGTRFGLFLLFLFIFVMWSALGGWNVSGPRGSTIVWGCRPFHDSTPTRLEWVQQVGTNRHRRQVLDDLWMRYK